MHEVSLMQSALEIAEEQACSQGATRIHAITLRIGRLAGVVPDALGLAFEVVTAGTRAEGASLEVETVEVVCRCPFRSALGGLRHMAVAFARRWPSGGHSPASASLRNYRLRHIPVDVDYAI